MSGQSVISPYGQGHAFAAGLRAELPQRLHGVKSALLVMGAYGHFALRETTSL